MNTPIETVQHYIQAFNHGDVEAMAADFAASGSILDGMAPHVWNGPAATRDWFRDAMEEAKEHSVTDFMIKVDEPLHNEVTGESAYVVVPAVFDVKVKDRPIHQTGAHFTVALHKYPEGWKIASWAWTKGRINH